MNELINTEKIESKIYEIRGKQVMFSADVAKLYCVETKRINEVNKRNINRFPETFCFQLTNEEIDKLSSRSQIATLNKSNNLRGYNVKYLPYVLTEQGIMMLSGLLRSDIAAKVNVLIIDAFVSMRHYLLQNKELLPTKILQLEERVDNNTKNIKLLFDKFNSKEIPNNTIFYEGQTYDAYSFLLDILSKAKEEIILVDNYASKELLDTLKGINKKITIISSNIDDNLKKKYESQYKNIVFINNKTFHDRFILIDKSVVYTCGASFKDLGKKCFAINKIIDSEVKKVYIKIIKERIKSILYE